MDGQGISLCFCVADLANWLSEGTSMLKNMTRLEKDNDFFKALGDTDELSACLGLAREYCATEVSTLGAHILEIQSRLLDIGSVRVVLLGYSCCTISYARTPAACSLCKKKK